MHTLCYAFHCFSCDCSAHESRAVRATDKGLRSWTSVPLCKHWWEPSIPADPCSSQAATHTPYRHGTEVFALSHLHSELSVLRTLPTLLWSLEAKLYYHSHLHLHQLQSMDSRVHRPNFCSSFRLFRLTCDNGCVFKVFWKKLAGGHGHVKQGTVFAKTFCQFIQTDGKAVLCERPCSRSSEIKNKM